MPSDVIGDNAANAEEGNVEMPQVGIEDAVNNADKEVEDENFQNDFNERDCSEEEADVIIEESEVKENVVSQSTFPSLSQIPYVRTEHALLSMK